MGKKGKKESKKASKKTGVQKVLKPKDHGTKAERGIPGAGTAIRLCGRFGCDSEFQDKRYGKGRRVHNVGGDSRNPTYRCTVCNHVS